MTPSKTTAAVLAPALAAVHVAASDLGQIAVAVAGGKLQAVSFGQPSAQAARRALQRQLARQDASRQHRRPGPPAATVQDDDFAVELLERLVRYAAGEAIEFGDIPVADDHLSPFQRRVVRACRAIGRGQTRTYGELAATAGSPGAARAVGQVMATNRNPLVVPCHRVVGASGSLGGFSAPQGVSMKRRLLMMEEATLGRVTAGSISPRTPA